MLNLEPAWLYILLFDAEIEFLAVGNGCQIVAEFQLGFDILHLNIYTFFYLNGMRKWKSGVWLFS